MGANFAEQHIKKKFWRNQKYIMIWRSKMCMQNTLKHNKVKKIKIKTWSQMLRFDLIFQWILKRVSYIDENSTLLFMRCSHCKSVDVNTKNDYKTITTFIGYYLYVQNEHINFHVHRLYVYIHMLSTVNQWWCFKKSVFLVSALCSGAQSTQVCKNYLVLHFMT